MCEEYEAAQFLVGDLKPLLIKMSPDEKRALLADVGLQTRHRLATDRHSLVHEFSISGHTSAVIVSFYDDGSPGELFVKSSKHGSSVSGAHDAFATSVSLGLQHGVPIRSYIKKFRNKKCEPSGLCQGLPAIRQASSIYDYIAQWLELKFGGE